MRSSEVVSVEEVWTIRHECLMGVLSACLYLLAHAQGLL